MIIFLVQGVGPESSVVLGTLLVATLFGPAIPQKQTSRPEQENAAGPLLVPSTVRPTRQTSVRQSLMNSESAERDAKFLRARAFFRRDCVGCHGEDGKGSEARRSMPRIPDFSRPAWQERKSDSRLLASILDGKGTFMPHFRDRLSKEEVHDLVAYVRSLNASGRTQGAAPQPDYDQRFRQLQEELDELRKQFRELAEPLRKP
jgi:mono/diheme cytochrome c family protein